MDLRSVKNDDPDRKTLILTELTLVLAQCYPSIINSTRSENLIEINLYGNSSPRVTREQCLFEFLEVLRYFRYRLGILALA